MFLEFWFACFTSFLDFGEGDFEEQSKKLYFYCPSYSCFMFRLTFYMTSVLLQVKDTARCFCVSERIIKRRLQEYGISIRKLYSEIQDGELDDRVEFVLNNMPRAGNYCEKCSTRSLPGVTGEGLSLSLELGADGSASKTLCKAPNKCLAVFSVTGRLGMFRTK